MGELRDYSGEHRPDLKFEDFSKEALVRLIKAYQTIFVGLMGMWNTVNRDWMAMSTREWSASLRSLWSRRR